MLLMCVLNTYESGYVVMSTFAYAAHILLTERPSRGKTQWNQAE